MNINVEVITKLLDEIRHDCYVQGLTDARKICLNQEEQWRLLGNSHANGCADCAKQIEIAIKETK